MADGSSGGDGASPICDLKNSRWLAYTGFRAVMSRGLAQFAFFVKDALYFTAGPNEIGRPWRAQPR
jgi:hypothetical protein